MNLVQLTEDLRFECGATGATLTTVQSVTGEMLQLKKWIADSWVEIQNLHDDWVFNRVEISKAVTAGQQTRTLSDLAISDLREWKKDEFRIYTTAIGRDDEGDLVYESYLDFRDEYLRGPALSMSGRPSRITVDKDDSIILGPSPDTGYTVLGTYYKQAQVLDADADTPSVLLAQFQRSIVTKAMMKYGAYNASPEIYDRGKKEYNDLLFKMRIRYRPQIRFGTGWGA